MKRFMTFLGAVALSTSAAMAAPVTIEFDGRVSEIDSGLEPTGDFDVGTEFIASLTFDTTAPGTVLPTGTIFALDDFFVRFETGQILVADANDALNIQSNIRVQDRDLGDQISADGGLMILGNVSGMGLSLNSGVAPSDFFPDSTLDNLVTFAKKGTLANNISQGGNFGVYGIESGLSVFGQCDMDCSFSGGVTTIRVVEPVAAVPLPSAGLMLIASIGGVGFAARRRRS